MKQYASFLYNKNIGNLSLLLILMFLGEIRSQKHNHSCHIDDDETCFVCKLQSHIWSYNPFFTDIIQNVSIPLFINNSIFITLNHIENIQSTIYYFTNNNTVMHSPSLTNTRGLKIVSDEWAQLKTLSNDVSI